MAAVQVPIVLNKLRKLGKGTCVIIAGRCKGTGFHYGGGWVMSVAHNFQDSRDTENFHSLVSSASFTFNVDGNDVVFGPPPAGKQRMAFVHHLQPGEEVDINNKDIAMVKLGHQYEYGRQNYEDWENNEQTRLNAISLPAFAVIHDRVIRADDMVYAIHYGGDDNNMKIVQQKVTEVIDDQHNPRIELQPSIPHGASGCPVLNTQYILVGLFFGGGDVNDPDSTDDALQWNGGIYRYILKGVQIIVGIGTYMAYSVFQVADQAMAANAEEIATQERQHLNEEARESRLTIYLMTGEVINGPN